MFQRLLHSRRKNRGKHRPTDQKPMGNTYVIPDIALRKFAENELEDVKDTFKLLAKHRDGKGIDKKTFLSHFSKKGVDNSWTEALFHSFDTKNDGNIDAEEFFRGMAILARGQTNEKLEFLFDMYDSKSSGFITFDDLKRMFASTASATRSMLKSSAEFVKQKKDIAMCRATHDWKANGPNELSCAANELMVLIQKIDSTWYWVELNGKKGYVPASYVVEVDANSADRVKFRTPSPTVARDFASKMATKALAAADSDKDGRISKAEFSKWASTCFELNQILDQMSSYDIRPPKSGIVLSAPTNFRKIGHVGFNPETGGFEAKNLPSEWQTLFKQAGVTEAEASDPATAQYILKVITQNITLSKRSSVELANTALAAVDRPAPQVPVEVHSPPAEPPPRPPVATTATEAPPVPARPKSGIFRTEEPQPKTRGPPPTPPRPESIEIQGLDHREFLAKIGPAPSYPAPVPPRATDAPVVHPTKTAPPVPKRPKSMEYRRPEVQPPTPPTSVIAPTPSEPIPTTAPTPPVIAPASSHLAVPAPPERPHTAPPVERPHTAPPFPHVVPTAGEHSETKVDAPSSFLAEIRKRPSLKHVDPSELDLTKLDKTQLTGLASVLSDALKSRRFALNVDLNEQDEEDNDDWV